MVSSATRAIGSARQFSRLGARLPFGGRRAAYGASYAAAPRAHTRGREATALAVRARIRGLSQPHVATDPGGVLETARSPIRGRGLMGTDVSRPPVDLRCRPAAEVEPSAAYSIFAPNFSRKTRSPLGVIITARVPSIRRIHPSAKLWAHMAAPTAPARCHRRSLQSRHGRHSTRRDFVIRGAREASRSTPIRARKSIPESVTRPASLVSSA
jgi:hypothetical protein